MITKYASENIDTVCITIITSVTIVLIRYVDTSEKMNKIFAGVEAALA